MSFTFGTRTWIDALARRANVAGAFATISHIGDDQRGDVIIMTRDINGLVRLFGKAPPGLHDETTFEQLTPDASQMSEAEATKYVNRRLSYDSDLWVIEIDDKEGRHFLTEKVINAQS